MSRILAALKLAVDAVRRRRACDDDSDDSLAETAAREDAAIITEVERPADTDLRDGQAAESAEWVSADAATVCDLGRWR